MKQSGAHFIINPKSAGGATGKNKESFLANIRSEIGDFTLDYTDGPGAATNMTAKALVNKPKVIAVIGGDGTISEVVSGFFKYGKKTKTSIVVINKGTGGDFCRTLGAPSDLHLALNQITNGRDLDVDVGHVTFTNKQGQADDRYFINVAGCGMAGEVVQAVNKTKKRFGAFSYFLTSSQILWRYRNKRIRLTLDDGIAKDMKVVTVAICNGQFFGGGMQIAPQAELGDGYFNVVTIGNWNKIQSLWYSRNLYNGSINNATKVTSQKARKIKVEAQPGEKNVLLDCDGEDVGFATVEIELLPKAVKFRI